MLDEGKLDDLFADFLRAGNGADDIKQIYEVLPYLSSHQQKVLTLINTLAEKYDSTVLRELSRSITDYAKSNRHLGGRFRRYIESYSLYKHFQGYRATAKVGDDK